MYQRQSETFDTSSLLEFVIHNRRFGSMPDSDRFRIVEPDIHNYDRNNGYLSVLCFLPDREYTFYLRLRQEHSDRQLICILIPGMEHSVHLWLCPNDEYPIGVYLLPVQIQHAIRYGYAGAVHPVFRNRSVCSHRFFVIRECQQSSRPAISFWASA